MPDTITELGSEMKGFVHWWKEVNFDLWSILSEIMWCWSMKCCNFQSVQNTTMLKEILTLSFVQAIRLVSMSWCNLWRIWFSSYWSECRSTFVFCRSEVPLGSYLLISPSCKLWPMETGGTEQYLCPTSSHSSSLPPSLGSLWYVVEERHGWKWRAGTPFPMLNSRNMWNDCYSIPATFSSLLLNCNSKTKIIMNLIINVNEICSWDTI